MQLLINGVTLPVAQIGRDFLLLQKPASHPPGTANIVMQVDESERSWNVVLPAGISAASKRVAISAA